MCASVREACRSVGALVSITRSVRSRAGGAGGTGLPGIAPDLGLGDNPLGLLTSTYFLAFGAAQLPLGMLLDRLGPRPVESPLPVLAAAGTAVFAVPAPPAWPAV